MYTKQPDDLLLTNNSNEKNDGNMLEEDNFLDTSEITTADSPMQDMVFNYPPKQEDIIRRWLSTYMQLSKSLQMCVVKLLTTSKTTKKKLIPSEVNCFFCNMILSNSIQVTRVGKIFTTEVI